MFFSANKFRWHSLNCTKLLKTSWKYFAFLVALHKIQLIIKWSEQTYALETDKANKSQNEGNTFMRYQLCLKLYDSQCMQLTECVEENNILMNKKFIKSLFIQISVRNVIFCYSFFVSKSAFRSVLSILVCQFKRAL